MPPKGDLFIPTVIKFALVNRQLFFNKHCQKENGGK